MPQGPFASSVGVGRAEPEWASKNKVETVVGTDKVLTPRNSLRCAILRLTLLSTPQVFAGGEASDAPLPLGPDVMGGDLSTAPKKVDLLIVGAGLSGAVIAERCSKELGMTSLILDVRDHIGGNCYDYIEGHGIRASKYGAHLFHTKFPRVWDYVQNFSEWMPFDHRVKGRVADAQGAKQLVPIPPVQETVNTLFGEKISSEEEMQKWYDEHRVAPAGGEPANGEEAALSRVGKLLYEPIFKHYTKKQWDKYPEELDASVLMRLPCRTSTDDRYFGDEWQALPVRGYTRIFENMLLDDPNISIRLNVDFFKAREGGLLPEYSLLVYTGPIDSYFAQQGMPKLEYRSLRFEEIWVDEKELADEKWAGELGHPREEGGEYFQEAMVVNYPSADVPFTRIVEYKHVPNQSQAVLKGEVKGSLIAREYSSAVGDPYYPVPNPENRALYERYRELAEKEEGVCFVGRLASYKYFNMDQAILNALEIYDNMKDTGKLQPKRKPEDFGEGDGPK